MKRAGIVWALMASQAWGAITFDLREGAPIQGLENLPVIDRATATVMQGLPGDLQYGDPPLVAGMWLGPDEIGRLDGHPVIYETDLLLHATPEFPDGTVLPMVVGNWYMLTFYLSNVLGPMFARLINDPLAIWPGSPLFFGIQSNVVRIGVRYSITWEMDRAPLSMSFFPHGWNDEPFSYLNSVSWKTEQIVVPEPSPIILLFLAGLLAAIAPRPRR